MVESWVYYLSSLGRNVLLIFEGCLVWKCPFCVRIMVGNELFCSGSVWPLGSVSCVFWSRVYDYTVLDCRAIMSSSQRKTGLWCPPALNSYLNILSQPPDKITRRFIKKHIFHGKICERKRVSGWMQFSIIFSIDKRGPLSHVTNLLFQADN